MNTTEKEPYDLNKSTVRIVITLIPKQTDESSKRQCLIAASTHDDLPVAMTCQLSELEPLPQPIVNVLQNLELDLAKRAARAKLEGEKKQPKHSPDLPDSLDRDRHKTTIPQTIQAKLFEI
jgi:hypothetical protein